MEPVPSSETYMCNSCGQCGSGTDWCMAHACPTPASAGYTRIGRDLSAHLRSSRTLPPKVRR